MCLNETESVHYSLNYVLFTQYHKQENCYFEYQHDCDFATKDKIINSLIKLQYVYSSAFKVEDYWIIALEQTLKTYCFKI